MKLVRVAAAVLACLLALSALSSCTPMLYWVVVNRSETAAIVRYSTGHFTNEGDKLFMTASPLAHSAEKYRERLNYKPLSKAQWAQVSEGQIEVSVRPGASVMIGRWPPGIGPRRDMSEAFLELRFRGLEARCEGEDVSRAFEFGRKNVGVLVLY